MILHRQRQDAAVAKLIVKSMCPFDIVNDEGFVEFCATYQPDRTLISRTTLMRRIQQDYRRLKDKLIKHLKTVDYVATTTDLWTAHNR